ncbi:hypothetical protein OsI_25866 [Oryza sativa Indica Group]|uniref:Uncharacterized protein n=1 Tax=Oryza sativa subsp. indica TaxID=39946 RepID=A2YKX4_ORYSI|nr:hypothetical protein OsI_25866 [Oryza sativa Indica Group]
MWFSGGSIRQDARRRLGSMVAAHSHIFSQREVRVFLDTPKNEAISTVDQEIN